MKFISFCVMLFFTVTSVMAQPVDSAATANAVTTNKTQFVGGISYNSALNYYGRTDSLKSQGIYPFVGVNFKNGLYINSNFVFITNKTITAYAASIVEGGYQFETKSNKWSGNIFANTFFYQNNNSLVQSALKGSAGVNVSYLNKIVNLNFGANIKLSNSLDYGASAGIDHTVRIERVGKGVIVLDPSAYVYAGTQNFTKSYYEKKKVLFLPAGEQLVTTNSKKFDILSYEFSFPVVYALGKMNVIISPAYVLPQNLIEVPGSTNPSETGRDLFYATATVKFTF